MKKIHLFLLTLLMLLTISLSSCDINNTVTIYDINGEEITISGSIYEDYVIGHNNRYGYIFNSGESTDVSRQLTRYLGEYNGGYYFSYTSVYILAVEVHENIAGICFRYGTGTSRIFYLYDKVLYALNEAYEHLLISKEELLRVYTDFNSILFECKDNYHYSDLGTYLEDKVEFNKDVDENNIVPGYIVLKIDNNFVNNDLESYFKNNSYAYSVNSTDITLSFSHQLNYETIVMKLNEELDLDELEILANQLLEEDLFKEVEVLTKDYSVEELDDTQIIFDFDNVDTSLYNSPDDLLIDIKPSMINYNYQAYFSGKTFEVNGSTVKVFYRGFVDADTFVIRIEYNYYADIYALNPGYNSILYFQRCKLLADELYKLDFVKQVYPVSKGQSFPEY